MTDAPSTRYSLGSGAEIAYQVVGSGAIDVVYIPTGATPIDLIWDHPQIAANMMRLASFSRLILMDLRGFGSSERVSLNEVPVMQAWMDDVLSVMDAVGSRQASVLATSETGLPAMLLAASHPERVSTLALVNCYTTYVRTPDYALGMPAHAFEQYVEASGAAFAEGEAEALTATAPSVADDPFTRAWYARAGRLGIPPLTGARMFGVWGRTDLGGVIDRLQTPTLVVSRKDARHVRAAHGRYLAEHIPGAVYVELPGVDTLPFLGQADDLIDELEAFFTGQRPAPEVDRILATVLFTDIVGSTERAQGVGDKRWRDLLDIHDGVIRSNIDTNRGRLVRTAGDGMLATFDGPARAIKCAFGIRSALKTIGIDVRAGLHTGEIEIRDDDIGGIAVHIGARIGALAAGGEVLVSRTVKDLVAGSGFQFNDRGLHELKGIPDPWQVYEVSV